MRRSYPQVRTPSKPDLLHDEGPSTFLGLREREGLDRIKLQADGSGLHRLVKLSYLLYSPGVPKNNDTGI